ncbi:MAG: mechanosensitive ion channel [Nanoarchaeota archaeon]|nr:mechanosensitive ion channel [Nanoarchaeota archaeon]
MSNLTNQSYVEAVSSSISQLFTKLVVAIIILLLGFIIGRVLGKLVRRLLADLGVNKFMHRIFRVPVYLEETIGIIVSYGIYFISILQAFQYLGLAVAMVHIISAIVIILIALFIILAVKDLIPNLFVGIYIHTRKRIKPGKMLKIKGATGRIVEAGLLDTKLETSSGNIIVIPNVLFLTVPYKVSKR